MKKFIVTACASLLLALTTACGHSAPEMNMDSSQDTLNPVKVTITTSPETIHASQAVTIQAKVTQGNENVDDASEVKFEVWEDGHKDQSEMIDGHHDGEGVYSVNKKFEKPGTYFVISHVTARDMHTMPTKKLNVVK